MTSILDEILRFLKEDVVFRLPEVTVKEAYLVNTALELPLLTVDEFPGNDGVYLDNQPHIVRNVITLEAYADQSETGEEALQSESDDYIGTESNNPIFIDPEENEFYLTGRRAAMQILMDADRKLNEKFGLTMIGNIAYAPYQDPNVVRAVSTYFAYIDTRTNTIYRRINT